MKLKNAFLLSTLIFVITACSGNTPTGTATTTPDIQGTAAAIAETNVPATLTKIAEESISPSPATSAAITATISATVQITPAATDFESAGVCLGAALASETVPDNTVFLAGEQFEKTWWITNTGDCAWTAEYSLVFNRGELLGAADRYAFPGYVAPGQSIPFSLNLSAPTAPGTYLGFWELESPDGTKFGVGPNGGIPFWVQIVIPGPTPTPKVRLIGPQTYGSIRSDGRVNNDVEIGDNGANLSSEGFMTFSFGNLPPDASILYLVLDIDQAHQTIGDPFGDLGCLNVYADNYPGVVLWRFCSVNDLSAGAIRTGGPDAIAAFENALASGEIRLTFVFDTDTNNDNGRDLLIIREATIRLDWIP